MCSISPYKQIINQLVLSHCSLITNIKRDHSQKSYKNVKEYLMFFQITSFWEPNFLISEALKYESMKLNISFISLQSNRNELRLLYYIFILTISILGPSESIGQIAHQTKSGQSILLYSDFSWELDVTENKADPFESPIIKSESNNQIDKFLVLERFLSQEEILRYVDWKRSEHLSLSNVSAFEEKYLAVSKDIDALRKIVHKDEIDGKKLSPIYEKYFPQESITETKHIKPQIGQPSFNRSADCSRIIDTLSKKKKYISSKFSHLTSFTPERLINYFRERHYLIIENKIAKSKGQYNFEFKIQFNSNDVEKSYGFIPTDGFLRISLINGKQIYFKIEKTVYAEVEKYTGRTIYHVKCQLRDKDNIRFLRSQLLDEIGVMWSSGFESYPIYALDHFKQKIACINDYK